MTSFPTQARVVVIGGGIMGCSTAYHLAKLGWKDVVLLEQGRLSGGTTWHAAGLVGQLRSYQNLTRLIRYSTELYSKLEAETGLATGWKQCGSLSVARTEERMVLLRRSAAMANAQGVDCEALTPQQAGEKYPIMRTDDLVGAVWLPGDGKANPADITQALARGDRCYGIFDRDRLASYGWYSRLETAVTVGLNVYFGPEWVYMYKGFTRLEYRGRRLYAAAMANALKECAKEGRRGLVCFVEANNFNALKSCYRMGYVKADTMVAVKIRGRYLVQGGHGCVPLGLGLRPVEPFAPATRH